MKITSALREIRESGEEELKGRLQRLQEELFGSRMKRYSNQLDNTMKIRTARREIARVLTILSARALGLDTQSAKNEAHEGEAPTAKATASEKPVKAGPKAATKAAAKARAKTPAKAVAKKSENPKATAKKKTGKGK